MQEDRTSEGVSTPAQNARHTHRRPPPSGPLFSDRKKISADLASLVEALANTHVTDPDVVRDLEAKFEEAEATAQAQGQKPRSAPRRRVLEDGRVVFIHTKESLAPALGLTPNQVTQLKGFLTHPDHEGFDLETALLVMRYARYHLTEVARGETSNQLKSVYRSVETYYSDLRDALLETSKEISDAHREHAFAEYLEVGDQVRFSKEFAGDYVLLRLEFDGRLHLSHMRIFPRRFGDRVCRFTTDHVPATASPDEDPPEIYGGYIYFKDKRIYTVGQTRNGEIRYGIAKRLSGPVPRLLAARVGVENAKDIVGKKVYGHKVEASDGMSAVERIFAIPELVERDGPSYEQLKALVPDLAGALDLLAMQDGVAPVEFGLFIRGES